MIHFPDDIYGTPGGEQKKRFIMALTIVGIVAAFLAIIPPAKVSLTVNQMTRWISLLLQSSIAALATLQMLVWSLLLKQHPKCLHHPLAAMQMIRWISLLLQSSIAALATLQIRLPLKLHPKCLHHLLAAMQMLMQSLLPKCILQFNFLNLQSPVPQQIVQLHKPQHLCHFH